MTVPVEIRHDLTIGASEAVGGEWLEGAIAVAQMYIYFIGPVNGHREIGDAVGIEVGNRNLGR